MKRIFAVLLILCVAVTMFVACGEKTEEPTTDTTATTETTTEKTTETTTENTEKPADTTTTPETAAFDGKNFSIGTLPTGWKANEAEGVVTIAKENDMTSLIFAMVIENFPATVEQLADETSKNLPGSAIEDATIGANTFKKITAKVQDNEVVNLISVANGKAFNFTVNNFADADIQAILSSIVLK